MIFPYFAMFPKIEYANNVTLDLSRRAALFNPKIGPDFYSPAQVPNGMRADTLAFNVFGDSSVDWLLYLSNSILDPYYDWPLDDYNFMLFLKNQYGSTANATQTIAYWRTAWPVDPSLTYSIEYYDHLPALTQKYYKPNYNEKGQLMNYSQQKLNYRVNTNEIDQWDIVMNGNNVFNNGDYVATTVNGFPVGNAQVITANSTVATVQHVLGNTVSQSNLDIIDLFDNTITGTLIGGTSTQLQVNIDLDERVFWEPLDFYTLEHEKNTYKSIIHVPDPANLFTTVQAIRSALQAT